MYLIDTNHCSYIINRDEQVIQKISSLNESDKLAINTTIYGELIMMAKNSQRKEENLKEIEKFIAALIAEIYPLDKNTGEIYGEFKAELFDKFAPKEKNKRRKYKLSEAGIYDNDLWIACTAIQHNAIIVSQDSDFRQMNLVKNLKVECWK
ncbi:nuclease [Nostoc sp. MBR 210]|nr:nuclease [Nostoc sp. MBR 210]